MNKFEIKSLKSLLKPAYTIENITYTKLFEKDVNVNCFVFFEYKEHIFVAWEIFPDKNRDNTPFELKDKYISLRISIKNSIDFIEKTLFAKSIETTGNPEKYMVSNLSALIYDQLHSLFELGMLNEKFRSIDKRLNYHIIHEELLKKKVTYDNRIDIFYEIMNSYKADHIDSFTFR